MDSFPEVQGQIARQRTVLDPELEALKAQAAEVRRQQQTRGSPQQSIEIDAELQPDAETGAGHGGVITRVVQLDMVHEEDSLRKSGLHPDAPTAGKDKVELDLADLAEASGQQAVQRGRSASPPATAAKRRPGPTDGTDLEAELLGGVTAAAAAAGGAARASAADRDDAARAFKAAVAARAVIRAGSSDEGTDPVEAAVQAALVDYLQNLLEQQLRKSWVWEDMQRHLDKARVDAQQRVRPGQGPGQGYWRAPGAAPHEAGHRGTGAGTGPGSVPTQALPRYRAAGAAADASDAASVASTSTTNTTGRGGGAGAAAEPKQGAAVQPGTRKLEQPQQQTEAARRPAPAPAPAPAASASAGGGPAAGSNTGGPKDDGCTLLVRQNGVKLSADAMQLFTPFRKEIVAAKKESFQQFNKGVTTTTESALLTFKTPEVAQQAREATDGVVVAGKPLKVVVWQSKEARQAAAFRATHVAGGGGM